eukprot:TRINITY_DN1218_c0_g1_i1.p1 TRINITY_DN1218_c0_g1~~TRINITY_DN1218_c0_g1_i1.p1  ORF type:complete len:382 (-),score=125.52 TRINITY_DN1218_c0_g1_i1:11-1156(-)
MDIFEKEKQIVYIKDTISNINDMIEEYHLIEQDIKKKFEYIDDFCHIQTTYLYKYNTFLKTVYKSLSSKLKIPVEAMVDTVQQMSTILTEFDADILEFVESNLKFPSFSNPVFFDFTSKIFNLETEVQKQQQELKELKIYFNSLKKKIPPQKVTPVHIKLHKKFEKLDSLANILISAINRSDLSCESSVVDIKELLLLFNGMYDELSQYICKNKDFLSKLEDLLKNFDDYETNFEKFCNQILITSKEYEDLLSSQSKFAEYFDNAKFLQDFLVKVQESSANYSVETEKIVHQKMVISLIHQIFADILDSLYLKNSEYLREVLDRYNGFLPEQMLDQLQALKDKEIAPDLNELNVDLDEIKSFCLNSLNGLFQSFFDENTLK